MNPVRLPRRPNGTTIAPSPSALIEAIQAGKAAEIPYGPITTDDLDRYLVKRVKQLTDGDQQPIMTRPQTLPDFPLAVARQ